MNKYKFRMFRYWVGKVVERNGRKYIATGDDVWAYRVKEWKQYYLNDRECPMPVPEKNIIFR